MMQFFPRLRWIRSRTNIPASLSGPLKSSTIDTSRMETSKAKTECAPSVSSITEGAGVTSPCTVVLHQPAFTHSETRTIVFGISLGMFLAALNQTIVATALPTIGRDFDDFENLSWVVTAYLLTSTAAAPFYGKLCDIYGRRTMMLWGIGLFVAGSLACAVAPNMLLLILARALQGVGGGGILPVAQTVIGDLVAPRERGRYQGYIGIVWICAGVSGPVLGGFLSEHLHWSAVFWINLPLGLVATAMTFATLRRLPRHERPHELDIFGGTLIMASALALMLALTWGGTRFPWVSLSIGGLFAVSILFAVGFAWRVMRVREPFLPIPILANSVVRMGTAASSCAFATMIGLTIFMPLYYEAVHKLSAGDSGLALIPVVVMTTPGSILSGRAMMHLRHFKWVPVLGLSFALGAILVLALWPAAPLALAIVMLGIVGTGVGTLYPVATVSIQSVAERHQVGTATGLMNFCRSLFSAFVVAVMSTIMLAHIGVAPERGSDLETVLSGASSAGADFATMFRWLFDSAAVFLAAALLALVSMEELPLRSRES
jgi:EmrB/QacA subfamily drug resistance transporter